MGSQLLRRQGSAAQFEPVSHQAVGRVECLYHGDHSTVSAALHDLVSVLTNGLDLTSSVLLSPSFMIVRPCPAETLEVAYSYSCHLTFRRPWLFR